MAFGQYAMPQEEENSGGVFERLLSHNAGILDRPETKAALAQFGISMLQGRPFGHAVGDAAGAVGRHHQQQRQDEQQRIANERKQAELDLRRQEVETAARQGDERLATDRMRAEQAGAYQQGMLESSAADRALRQQQFTELSAYQQAHLKAQASQAKAKILAEMGMAQSKAANDLLDDLFNVAEAQAANQYGTEPFQLDTNAIQNQFRSLAPLYGIRLPDTVVTAEQLQALAARGRTPEQLRQLGNRQGIRLDPGAQQWLAAQGTPGLGVGSEQVAADGTTPPSQVPQQTGTAPVPDAEAVPGARGRRERRMTYEPDIPEPRTVTQRIGGRRVTRTIEPPQAVETEPKAVPPVSRRRQRRQAADTAQTKATAEASVAKLNADPDEIDFAVWREVLSKPATRAAAVRRYGKAKIAEVMRFLRGLDGK